LYGCHSANKKITSNLIASELKGSWLAKKDSLTLIILFLDSSHLKMPDLTDRIFTFEIKPMSDYSLFVVKDNIESSSVISYISHRISSDKIAMELSSMRYYYPISKTWIENKPTKEDSRVQIWERLK